MTSPHLPAMPPRREDRALVTGQGVFASDAPLRAPLHIAFLRSHDRGTGLTLDGMKDAAAMPGVLGVYAAPDLAHLGALSVNEVIPLRVPLAYPILAGPDVTAVGQPIAAVVAARLTDATDAAELIVPDFAGNAVPATQIVAEKSWRAGDVDAVIKSAAHTVHCTITHPRLAPSPMEPRSIAIRYEASTESVTLWHATQTPHRTRSELASILDIEPDRIRVVARHVGGAFGMKASLYPEEVFAVWAAFQHKRDVQWTAARSDDFLSATHGRGITSTGTLALDAAGRFIALRAQITAPIGPWLPNSGLIPAWNAARILPSGYDIPALDLQTQARQDGYGPTGIYRGAGRPEANALMERLIDKAAMMLDRDPFDLRRQNLLPAVRLPHRTATGETLDSGDYAAALDRLETVADYAVLKRECALRRASGALVGLGVAFYLEPSGSGWESARVRLRADGTALVASGSSSQGHARETAYAQIAAQALGLTSDQIDVTMGDTETCPAGIGALASRATAIGGSAVLKACRAVRAQLEAGAALPITAEVRYENEAQAWGYGAYLVQMSICRDTGAPTIERAVCVDDAGCLIDAALAYGQILGGFPQGFGEAVMERVVYDEDGQLLTGSFMDYAMPRACDVPPLDIHTTQTPSPMNLLGAKGLGEAGTIGAPAAILNAAIDALAPLGVTDLQMPLTPYRLWQAMQDAQTGETR